MKKKILILLILFLTPVRVLAAGGFGVSTSSVSMYPGESRTVTITSNNAVGKLNISSSNGGVASVSPGSVFIQTPGSSQSITITGIAVGTSTVSVVASNNFATMDEEILAGQTRNITVTVNAKPAPPSNNNGGNNNNNNNSNNNSNNNNTLQPTDNRSSNNNIKELSVDGYKLNKVNDNNYTLTVTNDVTRINVKATAQDAKAKVTGSGSHELKIGDNNIDVVVTAENGSQKKITIKVTRKDGFYIEDLDSVLKNDKVDDVNIIVKSDTKITSSDLEKIKSSKKIVNFNSYDNDKKLLYSIIVDGSKVNTSDGFSPSISMDSDNKKDMLRLSNYADGLFINDNGLPSGIKVKLYVGNKYADGDLINIYSYVNGSEKLDLINKGIKVTDGYITFDSVDVSDYLITMSTVPNSNEKLSNNNNKSIILGVIAILFIIMFVIILFMLFKKRKKKEDNNININTNNNYFN